MKNKIKTILEGTLVGVINGLIGAGGGLLAIPLIKKHEKLQTKSHATSIAVTFPLSVFSTFLYLKDGRVHIPDVFPYLPFGVLGALLGVYLLPKIPTNILKIIFALVTIFAGGRILFK